MSVLVVDDNDGNITFLRQLLHRQGLEKIYTETDARRVAEHLSAHSPDLVLLDLHMPHVDGFEVLGQIKRFAAGGYLPVLVMTADTTRPARERALADGAQDFLTKPVDATEATLRIANLLNTRQLYATLRQSASLPPSPAPADPSSRADMLARVQAVLSNKTLMPVFQPIVDLTTMTTVGHEGLSRFPGPGPGTPDRWFSDAFAVGLGVDLEWLAIQSMLVYFETAAPDAFLSLNLSPATVMHLVDNCMCPVGLCPRVVIELTEHVPVEDYSSLHRALADIRANGARLSADDLGSGYAGFRHLTRLKPDVIKLDISLVAGIHQSRSQRALTRALLSFAAEVGADLVAEGIEEEDELAALREIGIPYGQGYLLGRPAPLPQRV
jgi:EAL domain-containing protein (putative c-di-GMP-specific phosphodiesterase class I)/ActR/RegA family two-component response regulator